LGAASHCVSKRPIWLGEAALRWRRFAADNPAHRRIVAQALGRRSHPRIRARRPNTTAGTTRPMRATILATACVGQNITHYLGQTSTSSSSR